ncbi:MAG TPA: cyclase family protein, partial [Myxococcaceae bacterium]|nr:cyclase family protein [Myxococcaceae bacterium]
MSDTSDGQGVRPGEAGLTLLFEEGLDMAWMRATHWLPLLAATAALGAPSAPAVPSLSKGTLVDLTHPFDEKTLYWPTSPTRFELKKLSFGETPGGYFYAANSLCTPEHGGTHLDAPFHFARDGKTVDQIPVRQLIAPAVVLDVSAKATA